LQEANRGLRGFLDLHRKSDFAPQLEQILLHVRQAQEMVTGIAKLMQQPPEPEEFSLEQPVKDALDLMKNRIKRSQIDYKYDVISPQKIVGSALQIATALINMIDNSIYWLGRYRRKIAI
jgi:signal transduction histidine kinase